MTMVTSLAASEERTARFVLLASLALNVFLIGAGGAVLARHYLAAPVRQEAPLDRSLAGRIERMAATLPGPDGEILRVEYRNDAPHIDAARNIYLGAQEEVRRILRSEQFSSDEMRAAMVRVRSARLGLDQSIQDMIAVAATKMSSPGRSQLANWPPSQRKTETKR